MSNVRFSAPQQRADTTVRFADCWISPEAQRNAADVLGSGWVTTGTETAAFESEFATHVGAEHAVAVSSCTAALELALRALHLPAQAPVLVSSITFCGAVAAVLHAGLTPVLVDVDPVTCMPTPATTREAARSCGSPAAMMVVHLAGDPVDVAALADAAGIPPDHVVEDAAHALGSSWQGRPVGSTGTACFSFYATKNLPCGEGGMVTTDDADRAAWLRRARLHGMSADAWRRYLPGGGWRYDVAELGLKANMTDLTAALGRGQLRHLDAWQRRRAEIADRYDQHLAGLPGLAVPHQPEPGEGTHAWHLYPVRILPTSTTTRDDLMEKLADQGIGTSVHFIPVHHLSYYAAAAVTPASGLPGADTAARQLVSLPMYPRLTDDQVDRVCDAIAVHLQARRTGVA
ncbi:MAG: DegT/DnrJ/EryC1/StrS family aminotransferase [Nocardioidaceae bacterium]